MENRMTGRTLCTSLQVQKLRSEGHWTNSGEVFHNVVILTSYLNGDLTADPPVLENLLSIVHGSSFLWFVWTAVTFFVSVSECLVAESIIIIISQASLLYHWITVLQTRHASFTLYCFTATHSRGGLLSKRGYCRCVKNWNSPTVHVLCKCFEEHIIVTFLVFGKMEWLK